MCFLSIISIISIISNISIISIISIIIVIIIKVTFTPSDIHSNEIIGFTSYTGRIIFPDKTRATITHFKLGHMRSWMLW